MLQSKSINMVPLSTVLFFHQYPKSVLQRSFSSLVRVPQVYLFTYLLTGAIVKETFSWFLLEKLVTETEKLFISLGWFWALSLCWKYLCDLRAFWCPQTLLSRTTVSANGDSFLLRPFRFFVLSYCFSSGAEEWRVSSGLIQGLGKYSDITPAVCLPPNYICLDFTSAFTILR